METKRHGLISIQHFLLIAKFNDMLLFFNNFLILRTFFKIVELAACI